MTDKADGGEETREDEGWESVNKRDGERERDWPEEEKNTNPKVRTYLERAD